MIEKIARWLAYRDWLDGRCDKRDNFEPYLNSAKNLYEECIQNDPDIEKELSFSKLYATAEQRYHLILVAPNKKIARTTIDPYSDTFEDRNHLFDIIHQLKKDADQQK